jgi:hypothetical protein
MCLYFRRHFVSWLFNDVLNIESIKRRWFIIIIIIIISGVGPSPLGTAATSGLLYNPQMIDEGDCGAIGGMKCCAPGY